MASTDLARQEDTRTDLAVADREQAAGALAHVLGTGDLAQLTNEQRVGYYLDICQSLGLNPRTRPFDWIEFYDPETKTKKLTLYPNKSCAEQLRRQHQISVRVVRRELIGGDTQEPMFVVEVEGTTPTGRMGTASKYVPLSGMNRQTNQRYRLTGERLANAYAKAETSAMRRLAFSMVGMASPPERDELHRVREVIVDGTGRVLDEPTDEQRYLAENPQAALAIGEPTFETTDGDTHAGRFFPDAASQEVSPEELEQPKREGPRPTFKASDEDIKRWCGAWFGAVKGLSLDTDEARAGFVASWTADEWPKAKRTDSLKTMFARCTASEAGDFLAHVRALMDDERRELLAQADDHEPERGRSGDDVHDAVVLTGGPDEPLQPRRGAAF